MEQDISFILLVFGLQGNDWLLGKDEDIRTATPGVMLTVATRTIVERIKQKCI